MSRWITFRGNTAHLERRIGELLLKNPKICKAAMKDASQYMQRQAVLRAPVDEGNLSGSIVGEAFEERPGIYGAQVKVPSNSAAANYAVPMHENAYNLGANSLAKQAKVGVEVGAGYFSRMLKDCREKILEIIAHTVEKMTNGN